VGVEWKRKSEGGASLPGPTGALPAATSGSTISDDELARMARGGAPA